ncbi:hypothetical protein [Neorhizobium galegae]|uniref:hypothetical protein n=1 Tax=Neorhizobium galegae TaxID=399 RepID=UPI000621DEC5|nr:hypothetical protein [Neorhizobium galegae]CDZ55099.1 Hypothetical protein NGAL_HAMBI2427_60010 [Neorhizobium galegae bv. orientalis]
MQIANIMLALGGDSGNTVPKYGVTAAEVAVLRLIHGDEAVTSIEPTGEDKRGHRQEIGRLTELYGRLQPNGRRSAPAVDALFPGAAARVFETFEELDLPEEFYKTETRVKAAPREKAPAPVADKPSIGSLTVQQLREYASVQQIDLGEASKKADIVAAIEAAEAAKVNSEDVDEGADDDGIGDINDGHGSNVLE